MSLRYHGFVAEIVHPTSPEAVLDAVETFRPQVVLVAMDVDGADAVARCALPHLRVVGVSTLAICGSDASAGACLAAGASEVVSRTASIDTVVDHVRQLAGGALGASTLKLEEQAPAPTPLPAPASAARDLDGAGANLAQLTSRERLALEALLDGRSAQEIALAWKTSLTTVRTHIRNVLAKLGVHSQLQAVALARRAGWTGGGSGIPASH